MAVPRYQTYKKGIAPNRLRFREGKGYYAGKPVAVKARAAARTAPPATGLGSVIAMIQAGIQTPKQQMSMARQMTNQQIAAEQRAIEAATQQTREDARLSAEQAEGFSRALMGFRQFDADKVASAYGSQQAALGGFGQSLGATLQGTEQAGIDASQADVNRLASGGVVPTYIPTGEGAGYVQGTTGRGAEYLNRVGGAMSANELWQAHARGLEGADQANALRYQGLKAGRESLAKIAEIQATRPKVFQEALQGLQGTRNQQLATLLSALSLQTGNVEDAQQANLANKKYKLSVQKEAANQLKDLGLSTTGTVLPGYYRDPKTNRVMKLPGGTVMGPKGMPVKLATPKGKTAASVKKPSLTDWAKTQSRMMEGGLERLGIAEDSKGKVEIGWSLKNIKEYLRKQYGQAFINTYGQAPQIESMVNTVANTLYTRLKQRRRSAGGGAAAASGGVQVMP